MRPGFNPRWNHTKDSKIVLDATLLDTRYYKVRIKGKVNESREWSNSPLHPDVVAIKKGAFGSPSTKIASFMIFVGSFWVIFFSHIDCILQRKGAVPQSAIFCFSYWLRLPVILLMCLSIPFLILPRDLTNTRSGKVLRATFFKNLSSLLLFNFQSYFPFLTNYHQVFIQDLARKEYIDYSHSMYSRFFSHVDCILLRKWAVPQSAIFCILNGWNGRVSKQSKVADRSRGLPESSLFNSYYTEVYGRALLFSLDCSILPLKRNL